MQRAAKTPPVPDTATATRPWLAVLSIASSASAFVTAEFLPVGLLRYISGGMHISEGTAGLMVTMPGLLAAIAAPSLTIAIGGRDRRTVLLVLGLMLIGSNLLSMLAPSFSVLIVARVLFGVGLGGFWAIGAGLGARLVPSESVARATSIIFAGISAGMLIGGAAGALIGDVFGWRAAFGFGLMLSLLSFIAQWIYLPPLRGTQQTRLKDLLAIVTRSDSRIGLLTMAIVLTAQFATYTYITPFLAQGSGLSGKVISSVLLAYTVFGIAGNFAGGAAAARNARATLLAAITLFVVPVALLPIVVTTLPLGVFPLLGMWGVAYGALPVVLQMWMMKSTSGAREGGFALLTANFQIAIALGAWLGGIAFDRIGAVNIMYFGSFVGATGLLIFWLRTGSSGGNGGPTSRSIEASLTE